MIEHVSEDLPALLLGELAAARSSDVGQHLGDCPACRDELAAIAAATAAMRSAALVEPWVVDLPPLRLTDPGVVETSRSVEPARRPGWRTRWTTSRRALAGAVAAALLLGFAVGAVVGLPPRPGTATVSGPGVALVGLNGSPARGEARMVGHGPDQEMDIVVTGLPPAAADTFYEVWLIDGERTLAVGLLAPDGGRFPLPAELTSGFQAIDVSIQPLNGPPLHSGQSILRGDLA